MSLPRRMMVAVLLALAPAVDVRADDAVGFVEIDDNAERRARAAELLAKHRYAEALDVYRAAYADHRQPSLLYLIGCTAQVANRARLAEHYFRRYLEDAPDAPPTRRADAARRLTNLQALLDEGRAQWTPERLAQARRQRQAEEVAEAEREALRDQHVTPLVREWVDDAEPESRRPEPPGSGIVTAGITTLILTRSMILTIAPSLFLLGQVGGRFDVSDGLAVCVPVVGPIGSAIHLRGDELVWTAFALAGGVLEGLGLAMLVVGAVDLTSAEEARHRQSRLLILPMMGSARGGLSVVGEF